MMPSLKIFISNFLEIIQSVMRLIRGREAVLTSSVNSSLFFRDVQVSLILADKS
jgi:hypothetical protein